LVSPIEGGTKAEGVREQGAKVDIWAYEREVTRRWIRLHNEELKALYSSPNIIRMIKSRIIRLTGNVACISERRCAYRILVGTSDGERPLGEPRRTWKNHMKMNLQEVAWTGLLRLRTGTCAGRL
jgi:hypothetical protein